MVSTFHQRNFNKNMKEDKTKYFSMTMERLVYETWYEHIYLTRIVQ